MGERRGVYRVLVGKEVGRQRACEMNSDHCIQEIMWANRRLINDKTRRNQTMDCNLLTYVAPVLAVEVFPCFFLSCKANAVV
jgi:hypothetical protein